MTFTNCPRALVFSKSRRISSGRVLKASITSRDLNRFVRPARTDGSVPPLGANILCLLALSVFVTFVAGCSTVDSTANLTPASNETLEFYPGLVKGFEHTYPLRHLIVLAVTDACGAKAQNSADGQQIGTTMDARGETIQNLYITDLAGTVQRALMQAVQEAGMTAVASSQTQYTAQPVNADYVLESKVEKCWVKKQRVVDNEKTASWQTVAQFTLDATIYKPPFHVPFWQGISSETYSDPPDNPGVMSEDQASIYDQPGEVLSVAFTRSVEGIFKRSNLHSLIAQDRALRR
jgi:hypothetical protein